MNHTPLVIGNWKMNPSDAVAGVALVKSILPAVKKTTHAKVVIAPPIVFLPELCNVAKKSPLLLGTQNIHAEVSGAYTGEHAISQVIPYGVSHVIVGHSERRALGESNDDIARKISALLKAKLIPVICIGERERDDNGHFYAFIEEQIISILRVVPKTRYKDIVLAYEPIWAIGTGKTATVDDVIEMRLFITKVLTKHASASAVSHIRVLYGGSVNTGNAGVLYASKSINGFLVGGASLKPDEFITIINATNV